MLLEQAGRVGYVLKMYPRFSETFILNEILAHEAAGLDIEIFSLRPPDDGRFHEALARVRAPVTYLPYNRPKGTELWETLAKAQRSIPKTGDTLDMLLAEDARDVYQSLLLAEQIKARHISHLHAHFGSVSTTVARLASLLTGISYSFTAHAKDIYHESVVPEDLQRKLADASAVVTVSQYNQAYLLSSYDLATDNLHCIYNGLDLDQFAYQSPQMRPPRIVAVGRLVEKKGFCDLVAACKILVDQGQPFEAEIIGKGPLEAELQAQIESLGLTHHVRLVGPRPQGEVKRHIQQGAVFVAPCVIGQDGNRDGLPTVLLEAMALGTPCISTDVTGIPEILRHNETGLLVEQNNPIMLANAITQLLADEAAGVQLAMAARQLIEAKFDIHQNTARIRRCFINPDTIQQNETLAVNQPQMAVI